MSEEPTTDGNSSKGHTPKEATDCFPHTDDDSLKAPCNTHPLLNSFNVPILHIVQGQVY